MSARLRRHRSAAGAHGPAPVTGAAGATPLGAEDARILALESGPIRGHTLKVLIVEDGPERSPLPDLREAVESGLAQVPRWRQRLAPGPGTPTGLCWEDDPAWSIDRHVRAVPTAGPVDEQGLCRIVATTMAVPLDRTRPLWTLDVVPRLADGRWALVWKVHHCLADGVTAMRVGSRLIWTTETAEVPEPRRMSGGVSVGDGGLPGPARPERVGAGLHLAVLAGYRGLFLREFRRTAALSPLAADVGTERDVAFACCALDELRTIGRAVAPEVTINDVLLAVVAGALGRWLQHHHAGSPALKVQVPVSMHLPADAGDPGGNRDSFLLVSLPVAEGDPVARVRSVNAATRLRKNRHDARAIYALREAVAHAPGPVRRALQRVAQGPHEYSLNVSNVPGPDRPIRVLGHRVDALYSIAEIAPRHALRVAAVSLHGSLFVGLCADPHVVPDLDELAAGIRRSIDELGERVGRGPA